MKHATDDLLLDLAHGLAAADERDELRRHLAECPPCDERFRRAVAERVRARLEGPRRAKIVPFVFARRAAPAAVAVAAAAALVLFVVRPQQELQPLWLGPPGEEVRPRGAEGISMTDDWARALAAYEKRDANRAADLLAALEVPPRFDKMRRVYLASALGHAGRHEEAAAALEGLRLDALPEPWGPHARLTLALAYRATGRGAAADSVLRSLASEPGPAAERARTLLGSR